MNKARLKALFALLAICIISSDSSLSANSIILELLPRIEKWSFVTQRAVKSASYSYLSNNLLGLPESSIANYIDEIRLVAAKYKLNEKTLLQTLIDSFTADRAYHEANFNNPRDPRTRNFGLGMLTGGIACIGLAFLTYYQWLKPINDQINEYKPEMQSVKHGADSTITTTTKYHFTLPHHNQTLLENLLSKRKNYLPSIMLSGLAGTILGIAGSVYLHEFYPVDARHQERYEKLAIVIHYLEKALSTPRKNLRVTRF